MNYAMLTTRARRYREPATPPPPRPEWDISRMALAASPGPPLVGTQGIAFSDDGSLMYAVAGGSPARVVSQTLAVPWDAASLRTTVDTLLLPTNSATSVDVSADGNNIYVITSSDGISYSLLRYSMSSPWSLASASLAETLPLLNGVETGVSLAPQGDRFYIVSRQTNSVHQFAMPVAWELSSSTLVGSKDLSSFGSGVDGPEDVYVRSDGVMMYVTFRGTSVDAKIVQFAMETPWDVTTLTHIRTYTDSVIEPPLGIAFRSDGSRAFISSVLLRQFDFALPGTITITSQPTSVFSQNGAASFSVTATATNNATLIYQWERQNAGGGEWNILGAENFATLNVTGRTVANDGEKYRVVVSAANAPSVTSDEAQLSIVGFGFIARTLSVLAQDSGPGGIAFGNSGQNLYVVGISGDEVNQYSLPTPWSLASASYVRTFSLNIQETFPTGVFFSAAGDIMYVCGYDTDQVHAFALSTPWDISTASPTPAATLSVASKFSLPRSLFFSADGSRMFVAGGGSVVGISRWDLGTPWDITTAAHAEDYSVAAYESIPTGVVFSSDGATMLVAGSDGGSVYRHALATPWSLASATLTQTNTLLVANSNPFGITASPTLDRVLVTGLTNSSIYQYNLQPV